MERLSILFFVSGGDERAFRGLRHPVAVEGDGLLCRFSTVFTARVSAAPPQHVLDHTQKVSSPYLCQACWPYT